MKQAARHLIVLLRELQKIHPEFPLQYAVCLAEISVDEGMSVTALSEKTGMPISTVSRIVGALSSHRRRAAPFGLVRIAISARERRRKELYLTPRGRAVMGSIADIIGPTEAMKAPPQRLRA